jgi:hypothetical protein
MTTNEERRRYFRITDTLGVAWRALSEEELQEGSALANKPTDIYSLLGSLENKISHRLGQFRIKDPAAAELFDLMNQKLNCMVNQMEAESVLVKKMAHRMQEVNISACGVGFGVDTVLSPEQLILLDFVLYPSNAHITCYGRVVSCDAAEDSDVSGSDPQYYTRIDFYELDEADQEVLIQHIVKRQGSLIRSA